MSELEYIETYTAYIFDRLDITNLSFNDGELRDVMKVLPPGPPDELSISSLTFLSGTLVSPLVTYVGPPETLTLTGLTFNSGELRSVLLTYTNWQPEPLTLSALTFIDGTLA